MIMEPGSSSISIGPDIAVRDQADEPDVHMCNICIGMPRNSVLTLCGHIFCWSCLYGWTQNQEKPCPVCKIMLRNGNIVPFYGCQRGSDNSRDHGSIPRPHPNAPLSASVGGTGDGDSRQPNGRDDTSDIIQVELLQELDPYDEAARNWLAAYPDPDDWESGWFE